MKKGKITFGKTEREDEEKYSHSVEVFADGNRIGEIRKTTRAAQRFGAIYWFYIDDRDGESYGLPNLEEMKKNLKLELGRFYNNLAA